MSDIFPVDSNWFTTQFLRNYRCEFVEHYGNTQVWKNALKPEKIVNIPNQKEFDKGGVTFIINQLDLDYKDFEREWRLHLSSLNSGTMSFLQLTDLTLKTPKKKK